jgi:orotidine-5'-phosphate decarboxylase
MNFVDRYLQRAIDRKSVLCVGLDPTLDHVPPVFAASLKGLDSYLREVIAIAAKRVPIIKLQIAYYAAMGTDGLVMLERLVNYAHSQGLLVILDAKRADIGETMDRYAREVAIYDPDACTSNPYFGSTFMPSKGTDSWLPLLNEGRAVITMIRTSNAEAEQLQDLKLANGQLLYEYVAMLVRAWNKSVRELTDNQGSVGGVVGATWPEQALRCRQMAGDDVFFLIPGYGAQGGGAEAAVSSLRNSRGQLMGTVNSSRGITRDSWRDRATGKPKPGDPLELVELAIDAANLDLNTALTTTKK